MKSQWNDKAVLAMVKRRVIDQLRVAAEVVEGEAKLLCPVDLGNLRNSIHTEVDEKNLSARVGTPVEYAPYVEFGTGEHAENGLGRKGGWFYKGKDGVTRFTLGSKPAPFLRPALINSKKTIQRIFGL